MLELLEALCGLQNFLHFQHFGLGFPCLELKNSYQASVLVMPGFRSGPGSEFTHNHLETISSNGEHIIKNLSDVLGWQNAPWLWHRFVP